MVRRPTEADFADVLTPEGNRGGVFGSDVADGTSDQQWVAGRAVG